MALNPIDINYRPEHVEALMDECDAKNKRIAELEAVLRAIADHPTGGVGCNPETFVKWARIALTKSTT